MKKYVRILGVMLTAVCVFAACDSGGGGDDGLPESVAYNGRTGNGEKIALTLTANNAASKTSGRLRVSAAFTGGGTYTLHLNDVLVSSGRFSVDGDRLTFTSVENNVFHATVGDNMPPAFEEATIQLDTGISLPKPELADAQLFEIPVYDSAGNQLGSNITVDIHGWLDNPNRGPQTNYIRKMGNIKNGKLTLYLTEVPAEKVFPKENGQPPFQGFFRFTAGSDKDSSTLIGLGLQKQGLALQLRYDIREAGDRAYAHHPVYIDEYGRPQSYNSEGRQWFLDRGCKWVCQIDPLPGKWKSGTLELTLNEDFTYSFKMNGSISSEGEYKNDIPDKITFTPNGQAPVAQTFALYSSNSLFIKYEDGEGIIPDGTLFMPAE